MQNGDPDPDVDSDSVSVSDSDSEGEEGGCGESGGVEEQVEGEMEEEGGGENIFGQRIAEEVAPVSDTSKIAAVSRAMVKKTRAKLKEAMATTTIVDIILDKAKCLDKETVLNELNISLSKCFPQLEGDKCTFIGSTFTRFGEKEPFKNHCIVLNTCATATTTTTNIEIES